MDLIDFKIDNSFDSIIHESEFYYSKAQELWEQWKQYHILGSELEKLKSLSYEDFCNSVDVLVSGVRRLLFKFIAYVDSHAREKNTLNEYTDKRTVAKSNIRQNDWVNQLLKYKSNPNSLSPGVRNLIDYLENPEKNWPIASEDHKKWIYEYFIHEAYDPASFNDRMDKFLGHFWNGDNIANKTCYLTKCLYSMDYAWKRDKSAYPSDEVEGVFVHETDDSWKEQLSKEMSSGRKGCIWWHIKPINFKNEILKGLRDKINSGNTFEFYYIRSNEAYYRAIVSDFADESDYDSKKQLWQKQDPVWFGQSLEEYEDGKRCAQIVFLITKFERLNQPIPLECFRKYRNMSYNVRTGMAAFSYIVSKAEFENIKRMEKYKNSLLISKNMILTGAPGTGKTYLAQKIAESLGAVTEMVQFHPSYDYTDFVEGIRPIKSKDGQGVGFEYRRGIFKKFCAKALDEYQRAADNGTEPTPYVFIIDEINRGDLAKIFGELFFAIDPNYRGNSNKIVTQYQEMIDSKDPFYNGFFVPENVFIIGTMNDIDRSVDSIDFALRRRFIWPKVKAQDTISMLSQLGDMSLEAQKRMTQLNQAIAETELLSEDFQIGGAYFLKLAQFKSNPYPFEKLWEYCIEPLLIEYLRGAENAKENLASLKKAYENAD